MEIQIRKRKFKINVGQNKEAWDYINTGFWEKHTFNILDYFVKKQAIVLDIGAWSGVISLYIAEKAKKVYAIDPDPICFRELKTNVLLNPLLENKINCFSIGISDKNELVHLSAREKYGKSSSSILNRRRDNMTATQIKTISLLDFIKQEKINHLDFIKMDIEGAEFQILPLLKIALQNTNFPTLYISFHYQFLNENIYYDKIKSVFLNKLCLKIEHITGVYFFKNELKKRTKYLFNALQSYTYIYNTKGKLLSFSFLKNNIEFIKNHDLIFTNTKWEK